MADKRVPLLLKAPASVRFLSCEPLLENIDLFLWSADPARSYGLRGDEIHWVIVGGESGGQARPFNLQWARSLRLQCHNAGVAFFMKQIGRDTHFEADGKPAYCHKDRDGRDPAEWPSDLRVQEFPEVRHV